MILKTISKKYENEIVINKSRFIAYLKNVDSKKEAEDFILEIKEKHFDARHNCSAYIIYDNQFHKKSDDDGEPSKTAGYPILNVLEKNNLINVVCVVSRYFGGIKLGAGGLVRAYSSSTVKVLDLAHIFTLVDAQKVSIEVSYELSNAVIYFLENNAQIIRKEYNLKVLVVFLIANSLVIKVLDDLKNMSNNNIKLVAKSNSYIKKNQ